MPSFYRPRIGISARLLEQRAFREAGHERDALAVLGRHVEWVAVRPEVEGGRAVCDLSGYILKSRAPWMDGLPNLPIEEEECLLDPRRRQHFAERVFAYYRIRALFSSAWTTGDLVAFHTANKMTLMAHSTVAYRSLGQLVANAKQRKREEVARDYESGFMRALSAMATPKRHANVLQHMLGYFKNTLDAATRTELNAVIGDHREGRVPLDVPIALFAHHARRQRVAYLDSQTYLDPHLREIINDVQDRAG